MSLLPDYAYVLVFLLVGVVFVIVNYFIPQLLSPKSLGARRRSPYESGEVPVGSAQIQFDISYYLFALIFIAFDVEVAFLFPTLVVFREMVGLDALFKMTLFLGILSFAILYAWKKDLFTWK
jgi:NADH-quinone oxidoreductase subunit A